MEARGKDFEIYWLKIELFWLPVFELTNHPRPQWIAGDKLQTAEDVAASSNKKFKFSLNVLLYRSMIGYERLLLKFDLFRIFASHFDYILFLKRVHYEIQSIHNQRHLFHRKALKT